MDDRSQHVRQLIEGSMRSMVRRIDPDRLEVADAVALVEWFAAIERFAAAGKTLAAGRVAAAGAWTGRGDRSAADWLAKRTGSTIGDARTVLDAADALADAPTTDAAFRDGALSVRQAEAVATAASADPTSEQRLLDVARCESLQKLRDASARVRAAADPDPRARHERIRRNRSWRRWTDADGARCGSYRLTPEAGALFEAATQPFVDAVIDEARRAGRSEPSEALAADGLVAMAASTTAPGVTENPAARGGRGRRRLRDRRELIALVDLDALHRGEVNTGETCEIAGVGPVPVDVVRRLFGDALLRIVIRCGVDIRTVVHTGRTASVLQETAVLVRDDGRCSRPTCASPISEIDHIEGYAVTHTTTLDDLAGLCGHDHDLKTRGGHTYRRDAEGAIEWALPDGTVERSRPPP